MSKKTGFITSQKINKSIKTDPTIFDLFGFTSIKCVCGNVMGVKDITVDHECSTCYNLVKLN